MLRTLLCSAVLACAATISSAAVVFEATPNETAGGFDIFALPGSSLPADSDPFVGDVFGTPGVGFAISGVESFRGVLSSGGVMSSLRFEVYEPTGAQLPEGCNAPCFDSEFSLTLLLGGVIQNSFSFFPTDDQVTGVEVADGFYFFDEFIVTDVTNTIDNEFFANFSANEVAPIPLPAGGALLISGLGLLALRRKAVR